MESRIEEFMNLNDEQRVALDLGRDIVVEAGAGSGKTRALVARYLKILEEGRARVDGIIAITFTENAASEMRERIRDMISSYIELYGETNNINWEAIKRLPNAPISTIHGFAARILKENPFESLLAPSFGIIEGIERRLFIEEAIDEFIMKLWESSASPTPSSSPSGTAATSRTSRSPWPRASASTAAERSTTRPARFATSFRITSYRCSPTWPWSRPRTARTPRRCVTKR